MTRFDFIATLDTFFCVLSRTIVTNDIELTGIVCHYYWKFYICSKCTSNICFIFYFILSVHNSILIIPKAKYTQIRNSQ